MTDKIQKIKDWISKTQDGLMDANGNFENPSNEGAFHILSNLDYYIDSLQEEHVSMWHDPSKETPVQGSNILMVRKEEDTNFPPIAGCFHGTNSRLDGRNWGYYNGFCYNEIEPPIKWAYIDDILNLSNVERTTKNWKEEPVSEDLEKIVEEIAEPTILNAYGTKELARRLRNTICGISISEDLGEYINELSKQFPEVSFAKLSRIAVRVAKWQKKQDQSTIELAEDHAYFAGRTKTIDEINEALLSEVLPCFMHGGEADEVVAKLDEVLNQK